MRMPKRLLALITGVTVAAYMTTVTVIDRDSLMIYFVGVASVMQAISMAAEKRIYVNCFAPALKRLRDTRYYRRTGQFE